jgi:hypothetical protein
VCYSRIVQRAGESARNARHHFKLRKHLRCRWKRNAGSSAANRQRRSSRSTFPSYPSRYPRVQVPPRRPSRTAGRRSRSAPARTPRSLLAVSFPFVASPAASLQKYKPLLYTTATSLADLPNRVRFRLPLAPRNSARRRHQSPRQFARAGHRLRDDRNGYSASRLVPPPLAPSS